jgi:hypothetical protein
LRAILLSTLFLVLAQGEDILFRIRFALRLMDPLRSRPLRRSRPRRLSGIWALYKNLLRSIPERLPPLSGREKTTFGSVTLRILSIAACRCPKNEEELSRAETFGVLYT